MKLVNPPVALMFHEGARRILAAGVHVPALHEGDRSRVALEAYPGLLVRKQLGLRASYKSDTRAEHTPARMAVRKEVVKALKRGQPLGVAVAMGRALERVVIADGSGDSLDAVICAVQAAWAWQRRRRNFGLPADIEPAEGWIVTA
jgi:predicted RNase H-like nuclease